jgi:hypothetical protein
LQCRETPVLNFPNFLFCPERYHWWFIFVTQLQRTEQNRTEQNRTEQNRTEQEVLTGTEENVFGSQEHYKFPQGICKDVFQICKGNEENCNQVRNSKEERLT